MSLSPCRTRPRVQKSQEILATKDIKKRKKERKSSISRTCYEE